MIDSSPPTGHRCSECGAFCGVVYEYRGPSLSEIESCITCGNNPPACAYEDGTVSGCRNDATHEGATEPHKIDRYWCSDHAPDPADPLPYVGDGDE